MGNDNYTVQQKGRDGRWFILGSFSGLNEAKRHAENAVKYGYDIRVNESTYPYKIVVDYAIL